MKNVKTSMKRHVIGIVALSLTTGVAFAQVEETITLNSETSFVQAYAAIEHTDDIVKLTIVNKAEAGGAALANTEFDILNAMPALKELDLSQDEITTALPGNTFQNNQTIEIVLLPVNLTSIGGGSFNGSKLKSITIPASVTDNDGIKGRFSNCQQLACINIEEGNPTYFSHEGVLYKWNDGNQTSSTLVLYPCGKPEETYAIVEGCTEVGGDAFFYNNKLKKITLSSEMQNIQKDGAWRWMTALEAFEVPQDNPYYFTQCNGILGEYARNGKSSYLCFCPPAYDAESLTIDGALVDSIGGNADIRHTVNSRGYFFGGVTRLKEITFTEGFKHLGTAAVRNAPEGSNGVLESIFLPSTITHIDNDAFCQRNQVQLLVCRAEEPPICVGNAFLQVAPADFYVPAASLGTYQSTNMAGLSKNGLKPFYEVTVSDGTAISTIGAGIAAEGMEVTISATEAEDGMVFDKWVTAANITIVDPTAATTTFIMGAEAVAVTATYKKAPATGMEITEAETLHVYPNPATDALHVNGVATNRYTIYNVTGAMVGQGVLTGQPIPVSNLANGIYVLKVGEQAIRFMKEQ